MLIANDYHIILFDKNQITYSKTKNFLLVT